MLKFIPQLAKLCTSLYNLKALFEQTSWLTHVANDHVIDLLSCNSILDHFQTSSFYSTVVDRAWFFTSNKIKLPKILRFLQCKLLFSHENNAGSNFSHSSTFFTDSGSKEKNCFEHRTMKNERKVVWNLSEFVKFLHDHAKQRRVAYLFSSNFCYRTVLKLIVKSSLL